MAYNLFNFLGQNQPDPSAQQGLQQYIQQGQAMIDPGQAQVAAANPIATAGHAGLANAFQQAAQNPALPQTMQPPQIATPMQQMLAQGLLQPQNQYQGFTYPGSK